MNARLHGKHTIGGIDKPLSILALGTAAYQLSLIHI